MLEKRKTELTSMAFIKNIENIEQHIASQRGKLQYHYKKWDSVLHML